jgi:hypothetical protein
MPLDHTGRESSAPRPVCQACGQPLKSPRLLCGCGHPRTSHELTRAGNLTWCAHYSPEGPCKCKVYTERQLDERQ